MDCYPALFLFGAAAGGVGAVKTADCRQKTETTEREDGVSSFFSSFEIPRKFMVKKKKRYEDIYNGSRRQNAAGGCRKSRGPGQRRRFHAVRRDDGALHGDGIRETP